MKKFTPHQLMACRFSNGYVFQTKFMIPSFLLSKYPDCHDNYGSLAPKLTKFTLAFDLMYVRSKYLILQHLTYCSVLALQKPVFVKWLRQSKNVGKLWRAFFFFPNRLAFYRAYEKIMYFVYAIYEIFPWASEHHAHDHFLFTIPSMQSPEQRRFPLYRQAFLFKTRIALGWRIFPRKRLQLFIQRALFRFHNVPLIWG